ncbi:uncharacterized protein V1518DRAFT_386358 [Limtongia smithiae]|uniref:uncharacterized protein n=1 Tax=Limtongia smithiae TaxID=1125753 RepID=UPI0034CF98F3
MGNQISQASPTAAPAVGIDSYVDELGNIQYDKTCGSARFMKTVRGRHKDGLVIVKIFIKPLANLSLRTYQRGLKDELRILNDISHALPYSRIVETERAGYLVRQYFGSILYDRVSIRPFLENIEKRWIAFQLLTGLAKCHRAGIHHGDIKTENIVVTSWNWVYLTDFASFKPTFLPEDDPSDFSFFFDTSQRRLCYIAPERFYRRGERKRGKLTDKMDIFSLGCVIAELFLEGAPIFTLSQLFGFRKGLYTPELSKIDDEDVRSLVKHMISLEPNDRHTADVYLEEWKDKVFPAYFYSFLHEYVQNITEPSVVTFGVRSEKQQWLESDRRIEQIYMDFDKIAFFLKFDTQQIVANSNKHADVALGKEAIPVYLDIPHYHTRMEVASRKPPEDCGALIFLSIIASAVRNTVSAPKRMCACDLILAIGEQLPDDAKLDRCLPYLVVLLSDEVIGVQVAALRSMTQLLSLVTTISPVNENIFLEYILPRLQRIIMSKDEYVRANYAALIATLAETSLKYLDMVLMARDEDWWPTFKKFRKELVESFQDHAVFLLRDSSPAVKRSLLRSISPLCAFFGTQKTNDVILSHLITYLNDKDALLRGAFFDGIIGLATFVGGNSFEEYIMPLMVQALAVTDTEEFVIEKVLFAFTSLAELGLIKRPNLWDLIKITIRFSMHPNLWIRQGVFSFISASARFLSPADIFSVVRPIVRPFLKCDILEYSEVMMMDFAREPLSRGVYNEVVKWASESKDSNFWQPAREQRMSDIMPLFDRTYSIMASLHNLSMTKPASEDAEYAENFVRTPEDQDWLKKLADLGFRPADLWKLGALREHIWRIAKASASNNKINSNRRGGAPQQQQQSDNPELDSVIKVVPLGVTVATYFFEEPQRKSVPLRPARTDSLRQNGATHARLEKVTKTIGRPLRTSNAPLMVPPYWLNGVQGSPRTMAPVHAIGPAIPPSASTVFMAGPTRVSTNDTQASATATTSDGGSAPDTQRTYDNDDSAVAERDQRDRRGSTTRHELRRRASFAAFINKESSTHNTSTINGSSKPEEIPGKAAPDVSASSITAYGQFGALEGSDSSSNENYGALPASAAMAVTSATRAELAREAYRKHSYTGDDPYILNLLDIVYSERINGNIPELMPAETSGGMKNISNRTASTVTRQADTLLVAQFGEHAGATVNRVVVSPDRAFFATAADDGTVKVWDIMQMEAVVTSRARQTYHHAAGSKVRALCMIENSHCFASGATDGSIHIVLVEYYMPTSATGQAIGPPRYGDLIKLRGLHLGPENGGAEGEYAVWLEHVKIDSRSTLIVATSASRILGINLREGARERVFELHNPAHHGPLTCLCVDRTRSWIAVGTMRGIVDVWNIKYQVRLKAWGMQASTPIYRIAVHPRPNAPPTNIYIAGGSCANGNEVTMWDVEKSLCKEVYKVTIVDVAQGKGGTLTPVKTMRYEPVLVDEEPPEAWLSRFANDPVQLLERTDTSVTRGMRTMFSPLLGLPIVYV